MLGLKIIHFSKRSPRDPLQYKDAIIAVYELPLCKQDDLELVFIWTMGFTILVSIFILKGAYQSMAQCKTVINPMLKHWSYRSLALSHQCNFGFEANFVISTTHALEIPWFPFRSSPICLQPNMLASHGGLCSVALHSVKKLPDLHLTGIHLSDFNYQ